MQRSLMLPAAQHAPLRLAQVQKAEAKRTLPGVLLTCVRGLEDVAAREASQAQERLGLLSSQQEMVVHTGWGLVELHGGSALDTVWAWAPGLRCCEAVAVQISSAEVELHGLPQGASVHATKDQAMQLLAPLEEAVAFPAQTWEQAVSIWLTGWKEVAPVQADNTAPALTNGPGTSIISEATESNIVVSNPQSNSDPVCNVSSPMPHATRKALVKFRASAEKYGEKWPGLDTRDAAAAVGAGALTVLRGDAGQGQDYQVALKGWDMEALGFLIPLSGHDAPPGSQAGSIVLSNMQGRVAVHKARASGRAAAEMRMKEVQARALAAAGTRTGVPDELPTPKKPGGVSRKAMRGIIAGASAALAAASAGMARAMGVDTGVVILPEDCSAVAATTPTAAEPTDTAADFMAGGLRSDACAVVMQAAGTALAAEVAVQGDLDAKAGGAKEDGNVDASLGLTAEGTDGEDRVWVAALEAERAEARATADAAAAAATSAASAAEVVWVAAVEAMGTIGAEAARAAGTAAAGPAGAAAATVAWAAAIEAVEAAGVAAAGAAGAAAAVAVAAGSDDEEGMREGAAEDSAGLELALTDLLTVAACVAGDEAGVASEAEATWKCLLIMGLVLPWPMLSTMHTLHQPHLPSLPASNPIAAILSDANAEQQDHTSNLPAGVSPDEMSVQVQGLPSSPSEVGSSQKVHHQRQEHSQHTHHGHPQHGHTQHGHPQVAQQVEPAPHPQPEQAQHAELPHLEKSKHAELVQQPAHLHQEEVQQPEYPLQAPTQQADHPPQVQQAEPSQFVQGQPQYPLHVQTDQEECPHQIRDPQQYHQQPQQPQHVNSGQSGFGSEQQKQRQPPQAWLQDPSQRLRLVSGRTAMRPATAHCLARLALLDHEVSAVDLTGPPAAYALRGQGLVVVDPCCGVGTLPIEAATAFPGATFLAGDVDGEVVKAARANMAHARNVCQGQGMPWPLMEVHEWDASELPMKAGSVDVVLSDLPWGVRESPAGVRLLQGPKGSRSAPSLRKLYPTLLSEVGRVLKQGSGRALLVSGARKLMWEALADRQVLATGLQLQSQRTLVIGGMHVLLFTLAKGQTG